MNGLASFRKTEFTIRSLDGTGARDQRYVFDRSGRCEEDNSKLPEWLRDEMSDIARSTPDGPERKTLRINSPHGASAELEIVRFLDITLGALLELHSANAPESIAVIDSAANVRLTYKELNEKTIFFARKLADIGLSKGDTVAVISPNSYEQIIAKLAAIRLGCITVNISPYEKEGNIEHLLRHTDISFLIMTPGVKGSELISALNMICPELAGHGEGRLNTARLPALCAVAVIDSSCRWPGTLSFHEMFDREPLCSAEELRRRTSEINFRDIATIIHTSGTTGMPKGVMLTHETILENALAHAEILGIRRNDRIFMPVPLFHAFGAIGVLCTTIIAGASVVITAKPRPALILELMAKEHCTAIFSVPCSYSTLCETVNESGFDASSLSLRLAVMAGDLCTEKTIEETQVVLGVKDVIVMYGLTEAGPGVTSTRSDDPVSVKAETVGRPWPYVELKLAEQFSSEMCESAGEICVRGYNIMKGYYKDAEASAKAIDDEGWLHTGDLGQIREDGNLVICGRIKDIIIRNGENISPQEVENFLTQNDEVRKAAVVGVADRRCGESIYAFIEKTEGSTLTPQDLLAFCKGRLPSIKIPERFIFVDSIPCSATGKLRRQELRSEAKRLHERNK